MKMNKNLINAVKKQLGNNEETSSCLEDVNNHGADCGFPGFTYYHDTVKFFKQNKTEIVELVKELSNDLGNSPIELVSNFQCLKNQVTEEEVARALYGSLKQDDYLVPNALTWFALEEVARFEADN
jgi:hypothetical protein